MSEINCNACSDLRNTSPNFVQNGITSTECTSLAADTGLNPRLNPKHNDAEDLHDMNDCLIGRMEGDLEKYDVCDWQEFMQKFISNLYEVLKGIICALGGVWTYIHNLLNRVSSLESRVTALETWKSGIDTWKSSISNTVAGHTSSINSLNKKLDDIIAAMGGDLDTIPVMRRYRINVPKSVFKQKWRVTSGAQQTSNDEESGYYNVSSITQWFGGAGNNTDEGELWIKVPITEMSRIVGVWTQTLVVPSGNSYDGKGKAYIQTVNVQQWYEQSGYLYINYDVYELCPPGGGTETNNGGPYPLTIDFLVVGEKDLT